MGQERKLEAMNWRSSLDGLLLSTRNNAIILKTNVEAVVRVGVSESSSEAETNFVSFNCVDEPRKPLSALGCFHRLNEDLVANQHARTLLRQTRDRKAREPVNFWPHLRGGEKYGQMEGVAISDSSIWDIELLEISPMHLLVQ